MLNKQTKNRFTKYVNPSFNIASPFILKVSIEFSYFIFQPYASFFFLLANMRKKRSQLQVQIMWYSFVTQVLKCSVVLSKVSSCLILNKLLKEISCVWANNFMFFLFKKAFINSCKQGKNSFNNACHKRVTLNIVQLTLKMV